MFYNVDITTVTVIQQLLHICFNTNKTNIYIVLKQIYTYLF